jgi:hypothetical protein
MKTNDKAGIRNWPRGKGNEDPWWMNELIWWLIVLLGFAFIVAI